MNTPQAMDREWEWDALFRVSPDYLYIERQAAEGWLYTLYSLNQSWHYEAIDGGTIDGRIYDAAEMIASDIADRVGIDRYRIQRINIPFAQLAEYNSRIPNFEIQGVPVYVDPKIHQPLPDKSLGLIQRKALLQTTLPVLAYQNGSGSRHYLRLFDLYERRLYSDQNPHIDVPTKSGFNRIYLEPNINANSLTEKDMIRARHLWYEPIYISRQFMDDIHP